MRLLEISDELKLQASELMKRAVLDPYIPGESALIPGDDPEHVIIVPDGFRCVFSYTRVPSGFYRDLSISIPARGRFPNPLAAFTIASQLFGFTGWDGSSIPEGWAIQKDQDSDAIRIIQELRSESKQ
jgi:hypothetical protein